MNAVQLIRTTPANKDYQLLVNLLDADLKIRDGEDHAFFAQYNKSDSIQQVVVAYMEKQAIGCGAFKPYAQSVAEIKRMFVLPEHRGKGTATMILKELETWAGEFGFSRCILETGIKQPEAIRVYQKNGYTVIPNYGQYKGVETSVCMERNLG